MAPPATFMNKLKVNLKMAIQRLRMVQQRDEALSKQARRAMAQLLEAGKYESARIRTENIIRSDLLTELHEILELYCELLLARAGLLEHSTVGIKNASAKDTVVPPEELDPGIHEAIVVIIHSASRVEIKELHTVRALLVERYGRQFTEDAMTDEKKIVPERVKRKLRIEPPSTELVESYLKAIASAYEIPYGNDEEEAAQQDSKDDDNDDEEGGGGDGGIMESIEVGAPGGPKGHAAKDDNIEVGKEGEDSSSRNLREATPTPPRQPAGAKSPVSIAPPNPRTDNANPRVKVPPGPPELTPNDKMKKASAPPTKPASEETPAKNGPGGKVPDVDDLEARFKLLKR